MTRNKHAQELDNAMLSQADEKTITSSDTDLIFKVMATLKDLIPDIQEFQVIRNAFTHVTSELK